MFAGQPILAAASLTAGYFFGLGNPGVAPWSATLWLAAVAFSALSNSHSLI